MLLPTVVVAHGCCLVCLFVVVCFTQKRVQSPENYRNGNSRDPRAKKVKEGLKQLRTGGDKSKLSCDLCTDSEFRIFNSKKLTESF